MLDNVSDPQLLEPEHLDRLPRDGHLDLIGTTRLAPAQIPGSTQDQAFISVDELPEEDALALQRSHQPEGRFPSEAEDHEALEIVKLLEGFTLAVETAAIYLGRHPAPDACHAFRERLKANLLAESEGAAGDSAVAVRHRERLLKNTLAFTFETLPPEALHLLSLSALLPADQVAVPWQQALAVERYPQFKDSDGKPSASFHQTMDHLLGLRLFQSSGVMDADGRPLVVRVHRLVQDLMSRELSAKDRTARQQAVDALVRERAATLENTTRWKDARWELEPFEALAVLWAESTHADAAWLHNQAANRWHDLAQWSRAEPLYRSALAIDEQSYGAEHPRVATVLSNLARLLNVTNRLAEAEPMMRRALAIDEHFFGAEHPNVARDLNNLAGLLNSTNRLVEAERLMRRALAVDEHSLGAGHPNVARDLSSLALLLQNTNRLAEAEPLMRRALAIEDQSLGTEHPYVANCLTNLALLLQDTNRLAEAESLMRRALAIVEQSYGAEDPNFAIVLNNLAQLLKDTNRLAEAEPLMRRALDIFEKSFGFDHTMVASGLNNLALLLQNMNRLAEAEPLMRRALEILLKFTVGTAHPHPRQKTFVRSYANLLEATGLSEEAVRQRLNAVLAPYGSSLG